LNKQLAEWDLNRPFVSTNDIDEYANFISENIVIAARTAVPQSTSKINIEISPITKHPITIKHQLYRIWKKLV
jgi:hypothetical protein